MNVLIIKLSSLGDVLVSSPLPRLLCESYPDIKVDHLVMEHCSCITKANPYIRSQLIIPFLPTANRFSDLKVLLYIVRVIYAGHYDKVFIFHRNPLLSFLAKLGGGREIYGFRSRVNWFLNSSLEYTVKKNRTLLEVELLRAGGFDVKVPTKLDFYSNSELPNEILGLLPDKYIVCNPGGGNKHAPADNRIWPIEYYINTINSIDLPFVLLGSGDEDFYRAAKILDQLGNKVVNLVNKTSFSSSATIIKNSELYLGNDSSLVFLAAAMGVKSISLYGPTQAEAALPIGPNQYYLKSNTPCSPCYDPFLELNGKMYTCKNNICMQSIQPNSVIKAILNLISNDKSEKDNS